MMLILWMAQELEGIHDETNVRSFAGKNVKAGTLALYMEEKLVLALGGDGKPDGVSVVLVRPPEGRSFALGGDGKRAGMSRVYYGGTGVTCGAPGPASSGATGTASGGNREMFALAGNAARDGTPSDETQLLTREAGDALSNAFEDLTRALDKETDEKKRRAMIQEFLDAQGDLSCSAVVFSSSGRWVLAIGAPGVEVSVPLCPLNVIASGAKAASKAKVKYLFEAKKR